MSNFDTSASAAQFGGSKIHVENHLHENNKRPISSPAAQLDSPSGWFNNPSIASALDFHNRGFNVFPCWPLTKKPAVKRWKHWQRIRQSETEAARLFSRSEICNIAIICGQASRCLYVVDCDDPGLYREYCAEIERLYGVTWTVKSKRGGHIYFFASRPVKSRTYKNFEIKGHKNYVLAPGSTHPDGTLYEFDTKPEVILHLDKLPFCELEFHDLPDARYDTAPHIPDVRERLFSIACRYANKGNAYETRSEFDMAIILAGVHIRAGIHDIESVLSSAYLRTHYNGLIGEGKKGAAAHFLSFSHSKACQLGDSPKSKQVAIIVQCVRQWANERIWHGRKGLSDKATLLAHVARCERASNPIFHLSCRDGAELAKLSHPTFAASTNRLIGQGLLERAQAAKGDKASCYRLCPPAQHIVPRNNENVPSFNTSSYNKREEVLKEGTFLISSRNCDLGYTETFGVFEHKVLGKAAEEIWLVLRRDWMISTEISRGTGRSPRTVRKVIQKLLFHRIIVSKLRGRRQIYSAFEGYDFEGLSCMLDSQHIATERRNRHVAQRHTFRHRQIQKKMLVGSTGL